MKDVMGSDPLFTQDAAKITSGDGTQFISYYGGENHKAIPAAVNIVLGKYNGKWHIVFNVRSQNISNPGAVVFPGGSCDPEDADTLGTALREFTEEMLLNTEEMLGKLQLKPMTNLPTFANPVGQIINPWVSIITAKGDKPFDYDLDNLLSSSMMHIAENADDGHSTEVDHVFAVPIEHFFNPELWDESKEQTFIKGSPKRNIPENQYKKTNFRVPLAKWTQPAKFEEGHKGEIDYLVTCESNEEPDCLPIDSVMTEIMLHLVSHYKTPECMAEELDYLAKHSKTPEGHPISEKKSTQRNLDEFRDFSRTTVHPRKMHSPYMLEKQGHSVLRFLQEHCPIHLEK